MGQPKLRDIVLGLVVEQPGYGYAIKNRSEERFGMGGNGVYQVLDRLVKEELLHPPELRAASGSASPRSAPRPIYRATDAGRQAADDWLYGSSAFGWSAQELDVRISFSKPHHWPRLIEQIKAQEVSCLAAINELNNGRPLRDHRDPRVGWPEAEEILRRKAQVSLLQARLEYLQDARGLLRALKERLPRAL
jgi:DNA-binding PadR family transcriptional regulator